MVLIFPFFASRTIIWQSNYWSRDLLLRHKSAFMVPGITENLFFIISFPFYFLHLIQPMCNVNCTTIKTKRQSNLGLLPKGGSHLFTLSFSNFKMSYLIQYLSYVHTVFGFQLLLTHSILNSRKIKTIPNFNLKKI